MMLQQLEQYVSRLRRLAAIHFWPPLAKAGGSLLALLRGPVRLALIAILQTLAALLVLFLEWGWRPLAALLAKLSKYLVFARFEAWLAGLPPYGALAMFAAPAVCLFPLKLIALYLFATGHPALGIGLIAGAKIVGTALVARIFMLTQPQLMQIGWFKAGYDRFMPWKEQMFDLIRTSAAWRTGRAIRVSVKRWINRLWLAWAPQRRRFLQGMTDLRAHLTRWLSDLARELR
jgi:hypothetical protein